jgi:hypothetical protein
MSVRLLRLGSAKILTMASDMGDTPEALDVTQRYFAG